MLNLFMQLARDSWGLIPLMILVLILGVAVALERIYFFNRNINAGKKLEYDLRTIEVGDQEKLQALSAHYEDSIQGKLVKYALPFSTNNLPESQYERHLDENIMIQLPHFDKRLWVLDTFVTLGPLLGLLGTIIHMIEAFSALANSSGQSAQSVTGPIAHALVATAVGLCIAIVCVTFLNFFKKRVKLLLLQLDLIKSMLIGRFARLTEE